MKQNNDESFETPVKREIRFFRDPRVKNSQGWLKFVFSKKATKNDEIFTVDLTLTT